MIRLRFLLDPRGVATIARRRVHPFPNGNGLHSRLRAERLVMQQGRERFTWDSANLRDADEVRRDWAVGREYITTTPFKRGPEALIKKLQEDNVRRRRIDEEQEAAMLAQAPMHIQALIVAAIDTGMRSGEMLALRFADIDLERGLITLRGETTKSRTTRLVPISTTRLRDVFAWLRRDVEGSPKPPRDAGLQQRARRAL